MDKLTIGFCFTGSFCTLGKSLQVMEKLKKQGADIIPIFSYNVLNEDTRFFKAKEFKKKVEDICGREVITSITDAEPLGPKTKCDIMCVAPCTGNTTAKISSNITDTPVTMAVKAHLRNERPLVLCIATNDGLGANAQYIGNLLTRKNVYFVPFSQDDPINKPRSVVADFSKLEETIELAMQNTQMQPIIF